MLTGGSCSKKKKVGHVNFILRLYQSAYNTVPTKKKGDDVNVYTLHP